MFLGRESRAGDRGQGSETADWGFGYPVGMAVDVKRVSLRPLSFSTVDQAMAEIERVAAAALAGKATCKGNWEVGQIFGHLAHWIQWGFDGSPVHPPWFVRLLGPLMKRKVLNGKSPQGFRLPGAAEGTYGVEKLSVEEGLRRCREQFARLKAGAPAIPNEVFGRMTHEEWIKLHLRHAEGHLGYVEVKE